MNSLERLRADLAELADEVTVVDLRDRALRASRALRIRRAVGGATAALAVVAIGVAIAYAVVPDDRHGPAPVSSASAPAPSASSSSEPDASTPPAPVQSSVPDPRTLDLRNATFVVPSIGDDTHCPPGSRRFVNGQALATRIGSNDYVYEISAAPPAYADLDGDPGDEVLLTVTCGGSGSVNVSQLLALTPTVDGALRTLGSVIATPEHQPYDYDEGTVRVSARVVLVEVMGPHQSNGGPHSAKQTRGYRYDNDDFHQVSGPVTFPAAPIDIHKVDLANTTILVGEFDLCPGGTCRLAPVAFAGGVGHDTIPTTRPDGSTVYVSYRYDIGQTSFITGANGSDLALATISQRAPDNSTVVGVFAISLTGRGWVMATSVVMQGRDGVTAIRDFQVHDQTVRVTLRTTSSGTGWVQRTYRQEQNNRWTLVS